MAKGCARASATTRAQGSRPGVSLALQETKSFILHEWPDGHGLRDAKSFATFSDGSFLAPLNSFRQHEQRLARYQRRMARKVKGSKNWNKAKKKVQRVHAEIANVRKDFLHKATTAISQQYALVVLEDLKVRNMSKSAKGSIDSPGKKVRAKSGLNKSILDQGWYEFRRQLEYKMQWQGGWLMTVNPRNTSRTCPVCGHVSADNRTTQAKFACVSCGHQAHADVVGAINILARGMQNMRHGGKDMPPNACIESFVSSPCEEMEETTCTYDLVFPEGHAKESQGFPLRGNRDSSHGGDVSHAKLARVKHASPMKQEPTEVILQDEYLEERRRNPRSIMGRWPMVFRVAKEGRGGCQMGSLLPPALQKTSTEELKLAGLNRALAEAHRIVRDSGGGNEEEVDAWFIRWITTPLRGLGGRTPLSCMDSLEGQNDVMLLLGRIEHGVYG